MIDMWPFKIKEDITKTKFHYVISMQHSINWTEKDKNGKPRETGNVSMVSYVLMENNLGERICKTSEPSDHDYLYKFYDGPYQHKQLAEDDKNAYKDFNVYKKTIFPWLNGAKLNEPWATKVRDKEKELRQKHPGLLELWEKYQAFLILCRNEKDFEKDDNEPS